MRRKDREIIDFDEMFKILEKCDCCRLGLIDEGEAYIVPMNFGYEKIENQLILYFHSANKGKKINLINKQNKASFEMDTNHKLVSGDIGCNYSFSFESIMGSGEIELIQEKHEKIHGLGKIIEHYTNKENWEFNEDMLKITSIIKLVVTKWSCKRHF